MPLNDLTCRTEGCDRQEIPLIDEHHGFTPEGDVDQVCTACGHALRVLISKVTILGDRRKGVTKASTGVEVVSPDRSVCEYGRNVVGDTTLDIVKPGETRVLTSIEHGATVAVTRSTGGGKISVVRAEE